MGMICAFELSVRGGDEKGITVMQMAPVTMKSCNGVEGDG